MSCSSLSHTRSRLAANLASKDYHSSKNQNNHVSIRTMCRSKKHLSKSRTEFLQRLLTSFSSALEILTCSWTMDLSFMFSISDLFFSSFWWDAMRSQIVTDDGTDACTSLDNPIAP